MTRPDSTDRVFFRSDAPEPWCYIPGPWVRDGTVFPAGDGQFYRLERQEANGWWCEAVPAGEVGSGDKGDRIRARLLEWRLATEEMGNLPAGREPADAQARAEDLREEVMRLCNERPWFDVDRVSGRGLGLIIAAFGIALAALFVIRLNRPRWVLDGSDTSVPWVKAVIVLGCIAAALLVLAVAYILIPFGMRRRRRLPGRPTRR